MKCATLCCHSVEWEAVVPSSCRPSMVAVLCCNKTFNHLCVLYSPLEFLQLLAARLQASSFWSSLICGSLSASKRLSHNLVFKTSLTVKSNQHRYNNHFSHILLLSQPADTICLMYEIKCFPWRLPFTVSECLLIVSLLPHFDFQTVVTLDGGVTLKRCPNLQCLCYLLS